MILKRTIGLLFTLQITIALNAQNRHFVGLMDSDVCACHISVSVWHLRMAGQRLKLKYVNPDANHANKCRKITVRNELQEAGKQELVFEGTVSSDGKTVSFDSIQERFTPHACPSESRIIATHKGPFQARLATDTCTTEQGQKIPRLQIRDLSKFSKDDWPSWLGQGYFLEGKICAGKLKE
ncbi:MAG: hypothetical protein U1F27_07775 [Turneriella sp.]